MRPAWAAEIVSGGLWAGMPERGGGREEVQTANEELDLVDAGTRVLSIEGRVEGVLLTLDLRGSLAALHDGTLPLEIEEASRSYQQLRRGVNGDSKRQNLHLARHDGRSGEEPGARVVERLGNEEGTGVVAGESRNALNGGLMAG